jgi:hypothetical protein
LTLKSVSTAAEKAKVLHLRLSTLALCRVYAWTREHPCPARSRKTGLAAKKAAATWHVRR